MTFPSNHMTHSRPSSPINPPNFAVTKNNPVESDSVESLIQLPDRPASILIAEDEHLIATDLADQLTTLGYKTIGPANSGQHAIALAKEHHPDLALMDIRMPEMDGLTAAGVLFSQMNIPVVIVTAYIDANYLEMASRIGIFGYVIKPVNADTLRATITIAWSRFHQHIQLRNKINELEMTLEERKLIEIAKGLLMKKLGLSEADALSRLRRKARDSRRRMADMARAIIDANDLFPLT